jgi:hypothetical protein
MIAFAFLFVILLVALVGASSHTPRFHASSRDSCGPLVQTSIGIARGATPTNGISRFAVRYGSAPRWQNAEVAGTWELPYVLPMQMFYGN